MQLETGSTSPPVPNFTKAPPSRIPAYKLGANEYEYQVGGTRVRGVLWVDAQDVENVLRVFASQGVALPIYREHKEEDGSFGALVLEQAADGGIDQVITWSPAGAALVASGRYMYDSPELVAELMPDGRRHLREIRSGSLVNKPARTGSRPLLMSAMAGDYLMQARKALEHMGGMEQCMAALGSSPHDKLKEAHSLMSGVMGQAVACIQSALEDLDKDGEDMSAQPQDKEPRPQSGGGTMTMSTDTKPAAEVLQMSAADRDALKLGAEVLKMTSASSSAEALGKLEAERRSVQLMTSKLVDLGVEVGVLPAADADKFKAYEPARLVAYMSAAPRIAVPANQEAERPPPQSKHADVEADVDGLLSAGFARHGISYGAKK